MSQLAVVTWETCDNDFRTSVVPAHCELPNITVSLVKRRKWRWISHTLRKDDIAPWEEEGHKCKNNISGTLAIKGGNG